MSVKLVLTMKKMQSQGSSQQARSEFKLLDMVIRSSF